MSLTFEGAFTALVTPFKQGEVDLAALAALTEFQVTDGIAGLVPCGTTGESPTLTADEHRAIVETVVKTARGRVPVIAGTGSNNTADTIARTRAVKALGVDAAMVVMPYYNKPSQAGLLAHVRAVHDATDLPLVLYNVPTRGTADLLPETVVEMAKHCPRVVALKEATGNIVRAQEVMRRLGDRLAVLSGDDALTLGMMACGARGVISVTSNALPGAVQAVVAAALGGDWATARRLHLKLVPVHDAMFTETNPGPVKGVLAAEGRIAAEVRLPLAWPAQSNVDKTLAAIAAWRKGEG
ncbi:MAG: 4-hydroxy-tetrahydrodipicolinate synthase [Myxococcales bacterium]|nr:4-hydroxy-tetrahydrodipicolinate synthase [Myxococcales bacterium]